MPSRERKKYNTTKHIATHIFESKFSYIMFYISYSMYISTTISAMKTAQKSLTGLGSDWGQICLFKETSQG